MEYIIEYVIKKKESILSNASSVYENQEGAFLIGGGAGNCNYLLQFKIEYDILSVLRWLIHCNRFRTLCV